MTKAKTLQAFTPDEAKKAHFLLGATVAHMMGRKFEEGDWAAVYEQAKGVPHQGWSNLKLDVVWNGLGIEHKMLCYRSSVNIEEACGKTLMHHSATRAFRVPSISTDPDEAMRDVLTQYANYIEARRAKVRESITDGREPDMRTGWLLWQQSLRQFLYFEEEMLTPNPEDYTAEWVKRSSSGVRKSSTNLWIYEKATGQKRFSITTEAGAKIQPYFDVPPPSDPNLYVFTVIGEVLETGLVRVWITEATARELKNLVGNLDTENLNTAIIQVGRKLAETAIVEQNTTEIARSVLISQETYETLTHVLPGVSDEHSFQLLTEYLRESH